MTVVIMFLSGLMATIGGVLLRSCSAGVETDLTRYWCGPQPHMLAQSHAHCAGCEMQVAGFVLMIAAVGIANLPRRRAGMERA